jgi:hypothetical protein
MNRRYAKELLGWGLALWLIGYILGIVFIGVVGTSLVGWLILPIGVAATCWVLLTKVRSEGLARFTFLGLVWALVAIALDYVFIVKAFHPADGYYKPDVYVYYALAFILPVLIGWWKTTRLAGHRPASAT